MKRVILGLSAIVLLGAAVPASAQSWGGDYGGRWNEHGRYAFGGYPEFRGEKRHIRSEIRQGREDGWLDEDQVQDFAQELRQVEQRESREFRVHGWNLPDDDREAIRSRLDELDQSIDQARDEQQGDRFN